VNGKAVYSTNKPEIVVDPYKVDVTNYNAIEKNGDIRSNSTSSYIYYGNVICFPSDCDPPAAILLLNAISKSPVRAGMVSVVFKMNLYEMITTSCIFGRRERLCP
jgi:hypothetical protein